MENRVENRVRDSLFLYARIRIISVPRVPSTLAWTHAHTRPRETRMDIPAFLTAAEASPPPANADGTQMRFS